MMSVVIASTNTHIHPSNEKLESSLSTSTSNNSDTINNAEGVLRSTSAQVSLSPVAEETDQSILNNPLMADDSGLVGGIEVEYNYEDIEDEIICEEDREILLEEEDVIIDEMRILSEKLEKSSSEMINGQRGVVVTVQQQQQHLQDVVGEIGDEKGGFERKGFPSGSGNNNTHEDQIQNLSEGRRRVWSIDLGRFLDCDDTSMGDLTLHHEPCLQETLSELPPLALHETEKNQINNINKERSSLATAAVSVAVAAATMDEVDMDEHHHTIHEINCKDIDEHLHDHKIDGAVTDPTILQGVRDRGLSFDIFASFHDETNMPDSATSSRKMSVGAYFDLDNDVMQTTTTARPRGDSIFFDNCNFTTDNSIIEEHALTTELLTRRRGFSITSLGEIEEEHNNDIIVPLEAVSSSNIHNPHLEEKYHHTTDIVDNTYNNSYNENHQQHYTAAPTNTSSTPITHTHNNHNNCILPSVALCQMELLNKGGRIGIYLPDARRARIAKFHSKRKLRIWRKRIKYDCRKKLADSRPRIKGRFVKRIDAPLVAAVVPIINTTTATAPNTNTTTATAPNINNAGNCSSNNPTDIPTPELVP